MCFFAIVVLIHEQVIEYRAETFRIFILVVLMLSRQASRFFAEPENELRF